MLRLSVVASATSNLNSIAATLNQVASTIGLMQQDVHELKGTNQNLAASVAMQENEIQQLRERVAHLNKELATASKKEESYR